MPKLNVAQYIQSDIDRINERAAWTADQEQVWRALLRDDMTDVGIMLSLKLSEHRYRRLKAEIGRKIDRILTEK